MTDYFFMLNDRFWPLRADTCLQFGKDTAVTRYGISPDTSDTLDAGFRHKRLSCPACVFMAGHFPFMTAMPNDSVASFRAYRECTE